MASCHKEKKCTDASNPACPDYNPCLSVQPLSADFNIYENDCSAGPGAYDTSWHYFPTDTIFTNCATFVVSDTTVDSVHWKIGAGTYTSMSFHLDFTNVRPTPVPITLTVFKHRNSCYPTDDTVKTLTKTLYFADSCIAMGSYKGYFDNNPQDTGTIAIVLVDTSFQTDAYHIEGFTPGCNDAYGGTNGTGGSVELFYTSIYFEGDGSLGTCSGATGSLYYNRINNTVVVNYKTFQNIIPLTWTLHHFNGVKIN